MLVSTTALPVGTALQPPNQPLTRSIFLQGACVVKLETQVHSAVERNVAQDGLVGIIRETRIHFQSLMVQKLKRELVGFVPGIRGEQEVGERIGKIQLDLVS